MQQGKTPAATEMDWQRAVEGIEFPISTIALQRTVHDRGGLDTEVLDIVASLPRDEYGSLEEMFADVRATYAAKGFDTSALEF